MSKLTRTQLLAEIAGRTGITKDQIGDVFDVLQAVALEQLVETGTFGVPGMLKLTLKDKPATPARPGKNPFTGETITIKAKPASKVVKASILKVFKDKFV
jgi:nucleoid DNA-binding protein